MNCSAAKKIKTDDIPYFIPVALFINTLLLDLAIYLTKEIF